MVGNRSDLCRLAFRAMVAPQVVFTQRFEILTNWNHRGTCRVERDRCHLVRGDARPLHGLTRGRRQGAHVILVGLSGVLGVLALAMQRVRRHGGLQ